jgi:hypothetical protein
MEELNMDFIKVFDKVIAVDHIKWFETEILDAGIKVKFYLDDGSLISPYKSVSKRIDREAFAEEVMSAIAKTFADLSDSDCEDIEDYLPYDEDDDYDDNDEEEEIEIITDSSQLYKLEKDHTGTYYTYYR